MTRWAPLLAAFFLAMGSVVHAQAPASGPVQPIQQAPPGSFVGPCTPAQGCTGVNNGTNTLTLGGALNFIGANWAPGPTGNFSSNGIQFSETNLGDIATLLYTANGSGQLTGIYTDSSSSYFGLSNEISSMDDPKNYNGVVTNQGGPRNGLTIIQTNNGSAKNSNGFLSINYCRITATYCWGGNSIALGGSGSLAIKLVGWEDDQEFSIGNTAAPGSSGHLFNTFNVNGSGPVSQSGSINGYWSNGHTVGGLSPTSGAGLSVAGNNAAGASAIVSIQTAGSTYVTGQTITLTGGTCSIEPIITITGVTGGGVTSGKVSTSGLCSTPPTNPVSQGSTSGSGIGATFNMAFSGDMNALVDTRGIAVRYNTGPILIGNQQPLVLYGSDGAACQISTDNNKFLEIFNCTNGIVFKSQGGINVEEIDASGNWLPGTTNILNLGSSGNIWNNLFVNTITTPNVSAPSTAARNIGITAGNASGTGAPSNGGNVVITAGTSVNGTAGTIQLASTTNASTLTASSGVFTDASKNLTNTAPSGYPTAAGTGISVSAGAINSNAVEHVSYQPGLLTAVNATKAVFHKFSKAATVDNIEGSAATFSCVSNPTITMYECGTSASCSSTPTTIGTVTVTSAGTVIDGTVSAPAITAGDYVAFAFTAGTCASIDIAATAQIHSN